MRYAPVALVLLLLSTQAMAGDNPLTTLPLHALETAFGPCVIDDPCDPGPPTVDVAAGTTQFIYLLCRNYDNVAGVQTAFEYNGWTFVFGLWDCQGHQVNGTVPNTTGGEVDGTIATAFDCLQGGATQVIGRFQAVATGSCIEQIESAYPSGTHVVGCSGGEDQIAVQNRGMVCVGSGGYDACETFVPVESATWGSIKAQYNN